MSIAEKTQGPESLIRFQQRNRDFLRTLGSLIVGAIVIGLPVSVHNFSPLVAIPIAFLLAGLVANYTPRAAAISVLVALLFQNLFVSLVSDGLSSPDEFKVIRGYNFVVLVAIWSVFIAGYFTRLRGLHAPIDKLMNLTLLMLCIVSFYFLLGFVQNPKPAAIYLRNIVSPLMVFQVMLLVSWRFEFHISAATFLLALALILFGYIELIYRDEWLRFTGSDAYWDLEIQKERLSLAWDKAAKETGHVTTGVLDTFKVDLFNTPLLHELRLKIVRLMGPNMHAISYSYAVTFLIICCLFRGAPICAALLFPLLVFANAKGALILLILVCFAWVAFKLLGSRLSFLAVSLGLGVYALLGIYVGLSIGDFHVLGFMGGLHNFLQFPLGHGIGVGGNLATDFTKLDWPAYQAMGRTPVAIESAVGVMLYQIGPGAFVLLGLYAWISWQTIRVASFTGKSLHIAAGFTLLTVLVNGIFQEEALFSPLALALLISLNGVILGQAIRRGFSL